MIYHFSSCFVSCVLRCAALLMFSVLFSQVSLAQTRFEVLVSSQNYDRGLSDVQKLVNELNAQSDGSEIFEITKVSVAEDSGQTILDMIAKGTGAMALLPLQTVAEWDSSYIDFAQFFSFRRLADAEQNLFCY